MQKNNNINKKNNVIANYEFIEKFILGKSRYIASRIVEFAAPFAGGFIHASLPDYQGSYTYPVLLGTFLGVTPTLIKYVGSSIMFQCKETFKEDINKIDNGVSRTYLNLRLEKLDQDEKEKTLNHVNKFIKSDKNELSDYLVNEKNNFAFAGAISYAAGFCFKKMFF